MPVKDFQWVEVPFEVQRSHHGWRVDAFLAARLRRYSRGRVQRLIAAGQVELRGRVPKPSGRVASGERVVVSYPRSPEPPPRYSSLPVIYEDDCLLAVDKPGDLLCHPTDRVVKDSAVSVVRGQRPGLTPRPAHRLDRETSGVLLFAKTKEAARDLTRQFTERTVRKVYLALVAGRVAFARTVVDQPLGREGLEIKVRQSVRPGAAPAATEFRRLAAGREASCVLAIPRTGRLHQIRVHLAWLGHPVLGDKLYTGGGEAYLKVCARSLSEEDIGALGAPRQMLHAWRLVLRHPATGRRLRLVARPPQDFLQRLSLIASPPAVDERVRGTG